MVYHTDMFRGYAQDNVVLQNESGGQELFDRMREILTEFLGKKNIPSKISVHSVKSGSMFSKKLPMLVIEHPDSTCKYFDIGICVNGNIISFPLLGESAENTKANKKQIYEAEGKYLRAALINPDAFKLQQESLWRLQVIECFNGLLS